MSQEILLGKIHNDRRGSAVHNIVLLTVLKCLTVPASTLCASASKRHCDKALFSVKANDRFLGVSKSGKFNARQKSINALACYKA